MAGLGFTRTERRVRTLPGGSVPYKGLLLRYVRVAPGG
jgi:hypothetical protein